MHIDEPKELVATVIEYLYTGDYGRITQPNPKTAPHVPRGALAWHGAMISIADVLDVAGLQELAATKFEMACEELYSEADEFARFAEFMYLDCKVSDNDRRYEVFEKVAKTHVVELLSADNSRSE